MMRICLLAPLCLLASCVFNTTKNYQPQVISGVYESYKPSRFQRVIIEATYKADVYPRPLAMVYFRKDGTYVFGFCDNQISQAGKYKVIGDSILLYDRYGVDNRMDTASTHIYYNKKYDVLCFMRHERNGKRVNNVIPLKKVNEENKGPHFGFLRGQEMDYDSIVSYYKRRSVDEQIHWSDSVEQSLATVKQ